MPQSMFAESSISRVIRIISKQIFPKNKFSFHILPKFIIVAVLDIKGTLPLNTICFLLFFLYIFLVFEPLFKTKEAQLPYDFI